MFMVHEDNTEIENPILTPKIDSTVTPFLASLLYILYETDFSEYDAEENKKTKSAKKKAVQKYITENKDVLLDRITQLGKYLEEHQINEEEIVKSIEVLQQELSSVEKKLYTAVSESRDLYYKISNIESRIQGYQITLGRYQQLESQYTADIKRLDFIVKSEKNDKKHIHSSKCPLCNSSVSVKNDVSYIEASQAELANTIGNIEDLSISMANIKKTINEKNEELEKLKSRQKEITNILTCDIKPQQASIKSKIKEYNKMLMANQEYNTLSSIFNKYEEDLKKIETDVDEHPEFHPKELFEDGFVKELSDNYLDIMTKCNYTPIESAYFDISEFDIKVNGDTKKSHGKGYRALLNSMMILAMRKYVNDHAKINPHIYIIDSPLHVLQLPGGITDENELPDIDFEAAGAKLIKYTIENEVSHGFLNGIRKK